MTGTHLEIERKYDVEASFVLPGLTTVPGLACADGPVEHALEADYFDTPDLRLAGARITLRRRTGGSDAGWHLKVPAVGGGRRELHAPLGPAAGAPPPELLSPVAGVVRGSPVAPVARLQTRRVVTALRAADGGLLAEVADDTVTATALGHDGAAEVLSWREVEIELADGDESLLDAVEERVLAAGARASSSASKLARVLAARVAPGAAPGPHPTDDGRGRASAGPTAGDVVLDAVRAQVAALEAADVMLRTDQPDAVHRMRVASRRLRSIFAAFRPVLPRAATEPLRAELKWLGLRLSDARDDEVALAHLRELVHGQPAELVLGPVAARLQQTELRESMAGRDRVLETVADPRYLRLLDDLHGLLADPPVTARASRPARPVLRRAVRRTVRRLRRRIAAADARTGTQRATALHEVRKAAKRVRYTGEVATEQVGRRTAKLVRRMEKLQDLLGEIQDTVATRERCRRLAVAATAAGESTWTYGRLHALEEARAERAERAFRKGQARLRDHLKAATG